MGVCVGVCCYLESCNEIGEAAVFVSANVRLPTARRSIRGEVICDLVAVLIPSNLSHQKKDEEDQST